MTGLPPRLVPALAVTDVVQSLVFWVDLLGFAVKYARMEEGFVCLTRDGADIMLDQRDRGPTDRRGIWDTGPMDHPFGRGINFQLAIEQLDPLLERILAQGWPIFFGPEERWYRIGDREAGVRQVLLQDPDGYLVRLQQTIGDRPTGRR
jgi:catechol 2,3-dioxygenase-like lactoylglutathione lyase family enzyme